MAKVLYEKDGRIARVTLNRPDVLNAIDDDLPRELEEAVERANGDAGREAAHGDQQSYQAHRRLRGDVVQAFSLADARGAFMHPNRSVRLRSRVRAVPCRA